MSKTFLLSLLLCLFLVPSSLRAQDPGGCADPLACNFDPDLNPDDDSENIDPASCEYLSCRDHGDPMQWTYCYGNNVDLTVTLENEEGGDLVLELNNALPTWSWLASNGDHLFIYDGPTTGSPLLYTSQAADAVVDGLFLASSGSTLTLRLTSNHVNSCGDGQDHYLDMQLYGAAPPASGCQDEKACNFNPSAVLPDLASPCEYLTCRDHGDPSPWTYCYGNNITEVFTMTNPLGADIVVELNNELPFWNWLASNGDHLEIFDGPGTDAPLIHTTQQNNGVIDGTFIASTGNTLTFKLTTNHINSCATGQDHQLNMMVYGASLPVVGCMNPKACNFNEEAVLKDLSNPCEFLSCRSHGEPLPWTYCYGNNMSEVFTLNNPDGTDIVLELNNDLPSWNWLASSSDHLKIFDGPDTESPLIYTSQVNNGVVDGTFVASSGTSLTLQLNTNHVNSCATGQDHQLDMMLYGAMLPTLGCMDPLACNYDPCAVLDAAGGSCSYLTCRGLGDGTPFDYCYGDNEDTTFVFVNPSAGEVVLELFNALPTYVWLASSTDHVRVYDGPDQGAPLLYTSIGDNAVIDGTTVVSTNDTVAVRLTSNNSTSCASGADYGVSLLFHYPEPGIPCTDSDGDGVCDDEEIMGCTYPYALNFPGCATEDDGSCFFPVATCPSDFNLDWLISIQDVLTLLSAFGNTCPGYEVGTALANCTYEEALNYNADALIDDGSCIFESPCSGDVNGDGTVTISDLLTLMTVFDTTCD